MNCKGNMMGGDHEVAVGEFWDDFQRCWSGNSGMCFRVTGLVGMRNGGVLAKECLRRELELLLLALAWSLPVGSLETWRIPGTGYPPPLNPGAVPVHRAGDREGQESCLGAPRGP